LSADSHTLRSSAAGEAVGVADSRQDAGARRELVRLGRVSRAWRLVEAIAELSRAHRL